LNEFSARSSRAREINAIIAKEVKRYDLETLERRLMDADIPVGRVNQPLDVAQEEHVTSRGLPAKTAAGAMMRFPVRLAGIGEPSALSPSLTEEII
jgi:crotonobetainyl-CoA:carnitine CoA-transferase CaiB-like acyl-CoA transferase